MNKYFKAQLEQCTPYTAEQHAACVADPLYRGVLEYRAAHIGERRVYAIVYPDPASTHCIEIDMLFESEIKKFVKGKEFVKFESRDLPRFRVVPQSLGIVPNGPKMAKRIFKA